MKYNIPTSSDQLQEFKEIERIELAEQEYKPTGIGVTVKGWSTELKQEINKPLSEYAEGKWGENLSDWDEEPQD